LDSLPSFNRWTAIVSKGGDGDGKGNDHNYALILDDDVFSTGQHVAILFEDSSGANYQAGWNGALNLRQWYHLAGIFDTGANTLKLYINGELNQTTSSVAATPNTNNISISIGRPQGDILFSNNEYLDGSIDDVMIFNRSLSAFEISALYDATANQYENNFTGLTNGTYTFKAYAQNLGGDVNETELRQVTIDTTVPILSFSCSPTSVRTGEIITCSCSATDNIDSSPSVSYTASPSTSSAGTYTTTCTATDDAGNSANSSIIYTVSSTTSSGGYPTYYPTQEQMQNGFSKNLGKNWKMRFKYKNETHELKINNIQNNSVAIAISSEPQTFNISINETKKINLNNDGYYDLQVFLKNITGTKYYKRAEVNIKLINETISQTNENVLNEIPPTENEKSKFNYFIISGIILTILVLFIVRKLIKRKRF